MVTRRTVRNPNPGMEVANLAEIEECKGNHWHPWARQQSQLQLSAKNRVRELVIFYICPNCHAEKDVHIDGRWNQMHVARRYPEGWDKVTGTRSEHREAFYKILVDESRPTAVRVAEEPKKVAAAQKSAKRRNLTVVA